jgi:MFS family permease
MASAQFGLWLGLYAPLKILLPLLADSAQATATMATREFVLAAVTVAGSLVALVANPLFGALSDRTRGRWGARHPWVLGGSLTAALAIGALPFAASPLALVMVWATAKLGLNASMAGLNGSAADRVSPALQGGLWGWIGMAQPLGLVFGVAVCSASVADLPLAARVLAMALLLCNGLFLLTRSDGPCPHPAMPTSTSVPWRQSLDAFRHRPFIALWWSRFWLYLGWSASTVYLLYFLEERLGFSRGEALEAQVLLLFLYALGTAASAALAGQASDRLGRRFIFVLAGSGAMALACALMLISQTLLMVFMATTVLGLGYGTYVATHQALVVENLPDSRHSARDLGLFNGANTAPMVLSPVLAWLCVMHLGGYTTLFGVSAFLILASLLPLRGCRR